MNRTVYGFIANLKGGRRQAQVLANTFQAIQNGTDDLEAIILNGDIGVAASQNEHAIDHLVETINPLAIHGDTTQTDIYIQPGGVQSPSSIDAALDELSAYRSLKPTTTHQAHHRADHTIRFLPGTTWSDSNGYIIDDTTLQTGRYSTNAETDDLRRAKQMSPSTFNEEMHYQNLKDLQNIHDPARTVVVSHVPPYFGGDNTVDSAYTAHDGSGTRQDSARLLRSISSQHGVSWEEARRVANRIGWRFSQESQGHVGLRATLDHVGINKAVAAHPESSAANAHSDDQSRILAGTRTDELYWNHGVTDNGQIGLLAVSDDHVTHYNIRCVTP